MAGFLGMRGTGNWATDQRPKNWRQGILFLFPNGDAPLTAMLSVMKEESTDDPEYNWWTKGLATQAGTVTQVYTDVLSTAYTTGGVAGNTLYVKTAEAVMDQFRAGHQVLLRNTANYADDTNGVVTAVVKNGASSYCAVKLLEADPTTTGIADCNRILIIGNVNSEGAAMPDAIAYDPTKWTNYTQIFRTPLEITRTARKTFLRTGDAYKEAKREALQLHSVEMEKAFLWGVSSESTGSNGKPERTTNGLIASIRGNSSIATISDYTTQTDFTDVSWLDSGEEWLDQQLEVIFRFGGDDRMAFCGSGVILAINKLIKEYGNYDFNSETKDYGIQVMTWTTPFGRVHMKRHPLFSYEVTNRYNMVVFDPADLKYRYVDDTEFFDDPAKKNTGWTRRDGTKEEFLTECGLEYHHLEKTAFLSGFNSDNGTP